MRRETTSSMPHLPENATQRRLSRLIDLTWPLSSSAAWRAYAVNTRDTITAAGLASLKQMSKSPSRRFPVTVTQLPVTRCQICHRTVAYRPGTLTEILTEHYRRAHPEMLDVASR
jgi:hypothetical protein